MFVDRTSPGDRQKKRKGSGRAAQVMSTTGPRRNSAVLPIHGNLAGSVASEPRYAGIPYGSPSVIRLLQPLQIPPTEHRDQSKHAVQRDLADRSHPFPLKIYPSGKIVSRQVA